MVVLHWRPDIQSADVVQFPPQSILPPAGHKGGGTQQISLGFKGVSAPQFPTPCVPEEQAIGTSHAPLPTPEIVQGGHVGDDVHAPLTQVYGAVQTLPTPQASPQL